MDALAYLLPPLSGFFAYLKGSTARRRAHGLQSVALGFLWPASVYLGSALSARVAQGAFGLGAIVWIALVVLSLVGAGPTLPVFRRLAGPRR